MKTKMISKTIIKHKEMTGKVIGISEEKNKTKIKLLLDKCDLDISSNNNEYALGDNVEMDVDIGVNKANKKSE